MMVAFRCVRRRTVANRQTSIVQTPISVRRFTADDQVAVRELVLAGLVDHWGSVDPTLNTDLDDIATSYSDGTTLVALVGRSDDSATIVGTGTIVPRAAGVAEIVRMSVANDVRGQGIGRMLVEALIDVACSQWPVAIERIVLETTATWSDTIRFYERCGFAITHHAEGAFGQDAWFERHVAPQR
jgi:putative acetyltransferase